MKEEVSKIIKDMVKDGKLNIKDLGSGQAYHDILQNAATECLFQYRLNFYNEIKTILQNKRKN